MIRVAKREDGEAIGRLWEALVNYHNALDPDLPDAAPDGARMYAQRIVGRLDDTTHTRVFVAEEDGRVVGYVLSVIVDMSPEMFAQTLGGFLADIYVEEAYRRSGIGRALVEAVRDWFRSRGVTYFEWYVAANNAAGHAFWQAVGGRNIMIRMRTNIDPEPEPTVMADAPAKKSSARVAKNGAKNETSTPKNTRRKRKK